MKWFGQSVRPFQMNGLPIAVHLVNCLTVYLHVCLAKNLDNE